MGRKSQRLERRRDLVRAFALVLAEHGYAGATIQAVAERAGFAPGLVHHHFTDKREILDELLTTLVGNFEQGISERRSGGEQALDAYIDAALKLDHRSDSVAAKCWVGILAEGLRDPALYERIRGHLSAELKKLQLLSNGELGTRESGALLAFILGSLVFGAFAPKQASGFAAPSARILVKGLAGA
jgi:TetR/AcrR family transcriptional repressor of bet genes